MFNNYVRQKGDIMKTIATLLISAFTLCSFGEKTPPQSFPSFEACKTHSGDLFDQHQNNSIKELFIAFGIPSEEGSKLEISINNADKSRAGGSKCIYVEEIGTSALGTFVTRIGYILKYEKGTMFYEVTIGKISPTEYSVVSLNFLAESDAGKLIQKIPAYYWK